jgi:hypothetical protein
VDAGKAASPPPDPKAAMIGSSGSSGGGPRAAQAEAEKAPSTMLDPKAVATPDTKMAAKRSASTMRSGGSNPCRKRFCSTWTCQSPQYVVHF